MMTKNVASYDNLALIMYFQFLLFRSWLRFWSDKRVKFNNGIQNSVEKWSKLTEQVLASRNFSDAKNLVEFMQSKKDSFFGL